MRKVFIGVLVSGFIITACSKTNEVAEGGNTPGTDGSCDTVNMKYATDVKPILEANCYGCHGHGSAEGGVSLETYTGVKLQADRSNLIGAITHASGYPPMPQGGAKLSDCNINKIKAWIARGTLNN
jgi:hypothetical protein